MHQPCKKPSNLLLRLGIAAGALCLATSANAATIVTDGGFESAGGGNAFYAGSSIDGGAWSVISGAVFIDNSDPYVHAGNNSLNLTGINPYASNSISEVLSTIAGQNYLVTFFANADSTNLFSLLENGIPVLGSPASIATNGFPDAVSNSNLFTPYSASFLANSATTTLNFVATSVPPPNTQLGSVVLDDVNVVAITPEPQSIVLVLTGLGGLMESVRRKRAAVR